MTIVVIESAELHRLIGEAVESAIARANGLADEWVDARRSPLGYRAFLKAAREGAFPASVVGNRYVARRSEVDAYMERQRIHSNPPRPDLRGAPPNPTRTLSEVGSNDDPVARALAAGRLRVVKKAK